MALSLLLSHQLFRVPDRGRTEEDTSDEGIIMATVQHEINKLKKDTLAGLDQSQEALEELRKDCSDAAILLVSDLVSGAPVVAEVAQLVHDFLIFEQDIVQIFDIDPAGVGDSDTLERVERDMQMLLASFDEKMEAMDIIGVAELLQKPMPAILLRFQKLLPVMRKQVYDFING